MKIEPKTKAELVDDKALYNGMIRSLSCKFDAFNMACVHIDTTVRILIDYYISYYQATIWTYDPRAPSPQPYAFPESVAKNIRNALQDRLSMYSLLSAASARITNIDGLPFPGSPSTQDYFMQQALFLMKDSINGAEPGAPDLRRRFVCCMMWLCSAEAWNRRFDAASVHLKAALRLLDPVGGVEMVEDQNLQGQLLMSNLALSCIKLEPCSFSCDFFDPGPSSTLKLTEHEFQQTHPRVGYVLISKQTEILPLKMRSLIYEIIDTYTIKLGLRTTSMSSSRAFETTHWIQKRNMAIRNRLLALKTLDSRVNGLRTALIMWTLLSMNITGRVMTVKKMAETLQSILSNAPAQAWSESGDDDTRLWILLVGHSCAQHGSDLHGWYSEQVRRLLLRRMDILAVWTDSNGLSQALVNFQQGCLYHDPIQRQRTEELAHWLTWWDDMVSV